MKIKNSKKSVIFLFHSALLDVLKLSYSSELLLLESSAREKLALKKCAYANSEKS